MGKLNCICGHQYSDTTESTWPVSYLLTAKALEDLCSADKSLEGQDVESRDVLTCPKCGVLAIQMAPETVVYQFYRVVTG